MESAFASVTCARACMCALQLLLHLAVRDMRHSGQKTVTQAILPLA
jgi:hypothetical protein